MRLAQWSTEWELRLPLSAGQRLGLLLRQMEEAVPWVLGLPHLHFPLGQQLWKRASRGSTKKFQ